MEPIAILTTLGKIFTAGALCYLGEGKQGFDEADISAIGAALDALSTVHGLATAKPRSRMAAVHTALVVQAFGTAFRDHWAGDTRMAPGLERSSWLHRAVLSSDEKARQAEVQARLDIALQWLRPAREQEDRGEKVLAIHAIDSDPITTPTYKALYMAFADGRFEGAEATALFDMRREGARLQFEGAFQMAYAELLSTQVGQDLGQFLLIMEQDRPRQLRRRLMEALAVADRNHVFGVSTPGVPMMPIGLMYVEPDGLVEEEGKPLRSHVQDLIWKHPIVLVRGDFGMGKSLTARMLAIGWAQQYVRAVDKTSPDLVFPIFIRCARDFQRDSFRQTAREALRNQAAAIGISLLRDDEALALPDENMRVVYLVDGLDEVALSQVEQERLFNELKGVTSARHRVVVFSRKGALPPDDKIDGFPVVDVSPFREADQVQEWLDHWNDVSGADPIDVAGLEKAGLLQLAQTPILLFMIAMTWDATRTESGETSQVAIYEHFFQQIAAGKCKHDGERHPRIAEASRKLKEKLVELGQLEKDASIEEAMLWLMSRIAWEYRRCEQRAEFLDLQDVNEMLRKELKLKGEPQAHEMIRMGALLVLQADLRDQNHTILFGHKSFLEFLTARFWADRLRAIVAAESEAKQKKLERELYGASLIDAEFDNQGFNFLMAILNGITWKEKERKRLAIWAGQSFLDERSHFEKGEDEGRTWRDDERPRLRHAALGIRCSLAGTKRFKVETAPLRSLLAWFWGRNESLRLLAPRIDGANLDIFRAEVEFADFTGADLTGADLRFTDLCGADLSDADLGSADLSGADLTGASLFGTKLRSAEFRTFSNDTVQLRDAMYDDNTTWPEYFDPAKAGAIRTRHWGGD